MRVETLFILVILIILSVTLVIAQPPPTDDSYECTETNGGIEICDGIDNDCDTLIDEDDDFCATNSEENYDRRSGGIRTVPMTQPQDKLPIEDSNEDESIARQLIKIMIPKDDYVAEENLTSGKKPVNLTVLIIALLIIANLIIITTWILTKRKYKTTENEFEKSDKSSILNKDKKVIDKKTDTLKPEEKLAERYIEIQEQKGLNDKEIKLKFKKVGWNDYEIKKVFRLVRQKK